MRKLSAALVLLAAVGCGRKDDPAGTAPATGSASAESAAQVPDLPLDLPSDDTPNVMHLGNKLEGAARAQDDVYRWLDDQVVPRVKPCFAAMAGGSTVQVALELGQDGRVIEPTVSVKTLEGTVASADKSVADCVGGAVGSATIGTPAPQVTTARMRFVVQ